MIKLTTMLGFSVFLLKPTSCFTNSIILVDDLVCKLTTAYGNFITAINDIVSNYFSYQTIKMFT